jgi:L-lysine exporter family protein LysE/ArgO
MWHDILYGMLLGYGAAVPIGPMNLEMTRRNLLYGMKTGISFGLGACCVDTTFMVLLGLGILAILANPHFLKVVGFLGALILFWFAYKAWTAQVKELNLHEYQHSNKPWWRHLLESYILTMLNPFTVIFWSSVSSQAAMLVAENPHAIWILGLNLVLYLTRERIAPGTMKFLNHLGAVLLIGFGIYGLINSLA